jgi:hypothetical protein
MPSSGILYRIIFLLSVLRFLVTANVVPSSPILVALKMEVLRSSETSVLTRCNIGGDSILHYCNSYLFKYDRDHFVLRTCAWVSTSSERSLLRSLLQKWERELDFICCDELDTEHWRDTHRNESPSGQKYPCCYPVDKGALWVWIYTSWNWNSVSCDRLAYRMKLLAEIRN